MSIEAANNLRTAIKDIAGEVLTMKAGMTEGEAIANVMLAYRHLEDASVIGIVTKVVYVTTDVVDKHILDDRV